MNKTVEILIVEDSLTQAAHLQHILNRHDYRVVTASNGREALTALENYSPTLVISDIVMPEMNGYEMCRRIKADDRSRDIPVMLLTSLSNPADIIKGLECGADNFVTKPYEEKYLIERIQYILINRELRRDRKMRAGIELFFAGKQYFITPERQQVLDLLLSTYELAVRKNKDLIESQEELRKLNESLEEKVEERTAELTAEVAERQRLQEMLRQRADELEKANRLKDEFLATVSHEMRTPLTTVIGWAHLLLRNVSDESNVTKGLKIIERNAHAQKSIINELLDFSIIAAGKLRLDLRPVDPVTIVEAAVESVRPAAKAGGLELTAMLDHETGKVSCDPERFQQVIGNMLANAVKFTPRGGRIDVHLTRVNEHLSLRISDTGEGIRDEFLPHVFDRFRQADGSYTRTHGGLGLGLAIARHIVERHGGTIFAESRGAGQGASFTVELPLMSRSDQPS